MPQNRYSINNINNINNILNCSPPTTTMPYETGSRGTRKRTAVHISSSEPSSPDAPGPSSAKRRRSNATRDNATSTSTSTSTAQVGSSKAPIDIEEIDLAEDGNSLKEALQKQRTEAVKAQAPQSDKPTTLGALTCVICMDVPTDLTATSCGKKVFLICQVVVLMIATGHLFCHSCLIEALKAGERNRKHGEAKRSQCPVCRKNLDRNKANDIIPLCIKQGKGGKRKVASAT